MLVESDTGANRKLNVNHIDVTYTEWRSSRNLLLAGHRGFETVIGIYDIVDDTFTETWTSSDISTGGSYISVAGLNDAGDCALIGEGFFRAPELAVIEKGHYRMVRSFNLTGDRWTKSFGNVGSLTWNSPDGTALQGWLLTPEGRRPFPLVTVIHGGPVWQMRPMWLARRHIHILMLLGLGCSIFFPNPRGSTGRGQEFVRAIYGDIGGVETGDLLSGVDSIVEEGIADAARLGVMGVSYGGFMTCWLITQDPRFAAAVAISPHTNHVTQELLSNIPHYTRLFLADEYYRPNGKYFSRSPVMFAKDARTPALLICGALDRCTPKEEAVQFYSALRNSGQNPLLVCYPEEGHGIRRWPALSDYAARVVSWFQKYLHL